jgi:thiol-disulfide isomerase/thioredoxin
MNISLVIDVRPSYVALLRCLCHDSERCGHCKSMAPAWEQLYAAYKDSKTALVAEVDCTTEGKKLCDDQGVRGFPTLKYGDPSALEDYQGGRDFASLESFAKENLKPMCSPSNLDLCDDAKKAEISSLMSLSEADLAAKISVEEKKLEEAEEFFQAEVKKLQETYQKLMEEKESKLAAVKASGLGLMKAVKAMAKKESKDEL